MSYNLDVQKTKGQSTDVSANTNYHASYHHVHDAVGGSATTVFLDHTKAHFSLSGKSLESTSNKVTPGLPPSTEKQPRNETEDQTKKKGYELSEGLHGERILLLVTVVHI